AAVPRHGAVASAPAACGVAPPRKRRAPHGTGAMAKCERGYLCEGCGQGAGEITASGLYPRHVPGEVPPEVLHRLPERHVRCNPVLAQFITDPAFPPVRCEGPFAKEALDPAHVAEEEARVTRGWRRLQELPRLGLTIVEYPLPEVQEAMRRGQE